MMKALKEKVSQNLMNSLYSLNPLIYFQPKKAALCFLISGKHKLVHEAIWRRWIDSNRDIIDIYFHCTDPSAVTSEWIRKHLLPNSLLMKTDYMHVVPAYFSLIKYAYTNKQTRWFCFLTDSCVPIISPFEFRRLFLLNLNRSIFSWRPAWWNINLV
jgi:hypothetical protein